MTIVSHRQVEPLHRSIEAGQSGRTIGIPKEITPGECRVAATPETAKTLISYGFTVAVETEAGIAAQFQDTDYAAVGCTIVTDTTTLWAESDLVLKVQPPTLAETQRLRSGGVLISFIWPQQHPDILAALAAKQATVLAMESVPRISRAQKLDALSSMANIAGYRAVIEASNHFGRFFPGQITAAGKIPPAKVLVIGAGVAGLAAIAAAKSLGAIVRAFDTRPAVKEQVESLGAEFLQVDIAEDGVGQGGYAKTMSPEFIAAEMALFAAQAQDVDIIITTALIPGKPAPKLITRPMVESMKPGSVIVDLAAEQGGNCELTDPGRCYRTSTVTIIGFTDLPSRMAAQASQLYGKNLCHMIQELGLDDADTIDPESPFDLNNEVIHGTMLLLDGTPPPPRMVEPIAIAPPAPTAPETTVDREFSSALTPPITSPAPPNWLKPGLILLLSLIGLVIGSNLPDSFLAHFTVFVLACLIGWQVIWNVKPALHTPLMSVTNAISGIIIIGGILQISGPLNAATGLGSFAILIGTVNIVGGFLVTQRMLNMFQQKS
ncbi:MAG: hypothetical protein RLZZ511_2300 [Cyanobacteriota bacterium]|jgi:H+-translocating NAD(P) transhydrogenase subunit alpha